LDSDDEWLPDYLARQAELVARYPGVIGSVLNCVMEAADGQKTDWFAKEGLYQALGREAEMLVLRPFLTVCEHMIGTLDACVFRRDVLLSTRLFDEAISNAEDWDVVGQMALKGPFVFSRHVGARAIRRAEDDLSLYSQFYRSGIQSRLCWARVFSRFLREARLSRDERQSLARRYARNQRALGNLYLRVGAVADARGAYQEAFSVERSLASCGRVILSFLPPEIGRVFLFRGRHIEPWGT
jgi:hypothetical protein